MHLGKVNCPDNPCNFHGCSTDPYPYPHRDMHGVMSLLKKSRANGDTEVLLISLCIQGKHLHSGKLESVGVECEHPARHQRQ